MVSNARLLLPEPERPVNTMRRSRGRSTLMFLRLCSRAPRTTILPESRGGISVRGYRGARAPVGVSRRSGCPYGDSLYQATEHLYASVATPGALDEELLKLLTRA